MSECAATCISLSWTSRPVLGPSLCHVIGVFSQVFGVLSICMLFSTMDVLCHVFDLRCHAYNVLFLVCDALCLVGPS